MMTTKTKKPAISIPPKPRKNIPCHTTDKTVDGYGKAYAETLTAPEVAAFRVVQAANPQNLKDEIDTPGMLEVLRQQAAAVNRGDIAQAEAMLMNQATALQSLFTHLTERGMNQSTMSNLEGFMRMALRAQAQCRATLETLAAIKNPPIVYARQANVTTGPQQINNGAAASMQAREIESKQTQLLKADHGQRMDIGTAGAAIGSDPAMATVGEVNWAEVSRG